MHQNQRVHTVKSQDGTVHKFHSITEFSKANGVSISQLSLLVNGHIESLRGWTLVGRPNKLREEGKMERPSKTKENELLNIALTA